MKIEDTKYNLSDEVWEITYDRTDDGDKWVVAFWSPVVITDIHVEISKGRSEVGIVNIYYDEDGEYMCESDICPTEAEAQAECVRRNNV